MKLFILILLSSLFIFSAHAQYEKSFNVYVHSLDEDVDLAPLKGEHYVKVKGLGGEEKNETAKLPSPKEMDALFKECGLNVQTDKMDTLDKDLFYLKLKDRDLASVEQSYPTFQKEKLIKLKKLIEERK